MLYFFRQFMRKIYIAPWILFITWILLLFIKIFDRTLWVQGAINIRISSIAFLIFVVVFLIIHSVVQHQEAMNYHWLVVPFAMIVFIIAYTFIITNQPVSRKYYSEDGSIIMVEEERTSGSSKILRFYKNEGLLAHKVSYCFINRDTACSYRIKDG